jgi:hypothetical protein
MDKNSFLETFTNKKEFWVANHCCGSDPDPSCSFDEDPDPTFHTDADPDPTSHFNLDPAF